MKIKELWIKADGAGRCKRAWQRIRRFAAVVKNPEERSRWKAYWKGHPYRLAMIVGVVIMIVFGGLCGHFSRTGSLTLNPFKLLFYSLFTSTGRIGCLIAAFLIPVLMIAARFFLSSDEGEKDERGFTYSKSGTYANSRFASLAKLRQAEAGGSIRLDEDLRDVEGILVGKVYGYYLSIPAKTDLNHNVFVIGSQGSYKSVSYAAWAIVGSVKMGESLVITDPKGEHYGRFARYLQEKEGYYLKVFCSKDFQYSDGWDMLGCLDSAEEITQVANTILRTVKGEERWDTYYDGGELNVLTALMIYARDIGGEHGNTFTDAYELLATKSGTELLAMFNLLRSMHPNHPANVPWNAVRDSPSLPGFLSGLMNKLTFMINEYLQEVLRSQDIDLELPARKKCAYFIIFSDQHSTYDAINSLFINLIIQRVIDYADRNKDKKCDVPVHFVLEEFPALGGITDFSRKLGTARSRGIGISMLLQQNSQIEKLYPKDWEALIGGCDLRIIMGCNDNGTAKYFSETAGNTTAQTESRRKNQSMFQLTGNRVFYAESTSEAKRELIPLTDILTMPTNQGIAYIRSIGPIKFEKVKYFEEYINDELIPGLYTDHTPAWRENYRPRNPYVGKLRGGQPIQNAGGLLEREKAEDDRETEEKTEKSGRKSSAASLNRRGTPEKISQKNIIAAKTAEKRAQEMGKDRQEELERWVGEEPQKNAAWNVLKETYRAYCQAQVSKERLDEAAQAFGLGTEDYPFVFPRLLREIEMEDQRKQETDAQEKIVLQRHIEETDQDAVAPAATLEEEREKFMAGRSNLQEMALKKRQEKAEERR